MPSVSSRCPRTCWAPPTRAATWSGSTPPGSARRAGRRPSSTSGRTWTSCTREDRAQGRARSPSSSSTRRAASRCRSRRGRCARTARYRWFRCSAAVADGEEPLVYLSAMDVTDLFEAVAQLAGERTRSVERTAELERSNAELERFASVVSHDLRQSLTAVSGFLALLESRHGAALPPNAAELLGLRARGRRAHARAGRGPARLRARRALGARPGARRRRASWCARIAPTAAAGGRAGDRRAAGRARAAARVRAAAGQPDRQRRQVRRARRRAGRDASSAVREGAGWRFAVADNGIGIPPPHAQRIFGMFARAPAGEEYPGHGDRARDRAEGGRSRGRADLGRAARRRR